MQVVGPPNINVKGVVNTEQVYNGILDCFSKTYRGSGLRGLYRGVSMHFNTSDTESFNTCFDGLILV